MSMAFEAAVRRVLDHGRTHKQYVVIPAADFKALADNCPADAAPPSAPNGNPAPAPRNPAYEREMRRLFDAAELDP
jgi:hypothetical protein